MNAAVLRPRSRWAGLAIATPGMLPDAAAAPASPILGAQALVEYGLLNTLARDVSLGLQRLGAWAGDNVLIVAIIVVALAALAFRRR